MEKFTAIIKYLLSEFISLFIKPDKRYWIFSSTGNTHYNYNSKYLFEYVLKEQLQIKCRYVINDDKKREELKRKYGDVFIETKSLRGIVEVLKAGVWFTSAGLPTYLLLSGRKRIIINLWHGVPLKKIVLLENNISRFKRLYIKMLYSSNYTLVITTSTTLINIMAESFGVDKSKIKVLGQPRNDLLINKINRSKWLQRKYIELPYYSKIILYAPTFRDNGKTKIFPFEDYDYNEMNKFLEDEKIIIFIRFHQSEIEEGKLVKDENNRIQFINEDIVEDIMEVLSIFDLLITDYSSIFIDFLILQKPEIFLPYDLEEYIQFRGLNLQFEKYTPGPKVYNFLDFKDQIIKSLSDSSYYMTDRKLINEFFNEVETGNCKRIVDYVKDTMKEDK